MTQASTVTHAFVPAPPSDVYDAFLDPDSLLAWLPPGEMSGVMHAFRPGVGGGYEMSLIYPPGETNLRGKTTDREDRVHVRFVELDRPRRIVQAASWETPDPAYKGEMRIVIEFAPAPGGTEITMRHDNLPPGLNPDDDTVGSDLSLDQLAAFFAR